MSDEEEPENPVTPPTETRLLMNNGGAMPRELVKETPAMADDTKTAIDAPTATNKLRQEVIGAVLSYADACERDVQPSKKAMALKAVDEAFNALIAAVRAERDDTALAAWIERELDASEPQPKGGQHVGPLASHWQIAPSTRQAMRWMLREWKARQ